MKLQTNLSKIKIRVLGALIIYSLLLIGFVIQLCPRGITDDVGDDVEEVLDGILADTVDTIVLAESQPKLPFGGDSFDAFLLVCDNSLTDKLRTDWKEKTRNESKKGSTPLWFNTATMYQETRWEKEIVVDGKHTVISCFFIKSDSDLNDEGFLYTYVCMNPAIL